jgi:DnaJ family protein A protein 2
MFFEDFFSGRMPDGNSHKMKYENNSSEEFYKILGLGKNADQKSIKKAWRRLCKTHHPDRGGDPEKFKECGKIIKKEFFVRKSL